MNNVKLLHMKCCFFQFFNNPVALQNLKKFGPQEKVEMTPLLANGFDLSYIFELSFPQNIREINSISGFKRSLKTHLFCP